MIDRDPVEILAEEFTERLRRGERPAISEYVERLPEHADRVRTLFPSLVVMENVADSEYVSFDESKQEVAVADLPLEQLGDYRIIREIGRGGMGLVYEAEQLSLGRHVALKVLSGRALTNPRQIKRFEHEARAAARLHHTNIVPVFDVGEHEGILFYVMQFIQGASLDQVLDDVKRLRDSSQAPSGSGGSARDVSLSQVAAARNRDERERLPRRAITRWQDDAPTLFGDDEPAPRAEEDTALNLLGDTSTFSGHAVLPGTTEAAGKRTATYWESVARIGVQVADALAYAHAQGIAHRDIKPSNLLLDTRGTVWITDFGLAKTRDQENLTSTGDFVGTLRYMAPERFAENADPNAESDPRSDIYSLGLTLYELLAFQPAFDELDRTRLMRQVMDGVPVRLRKLSPEVPRDLETIVHKAIERDPNHRVQTAAELAADLRRFLDDEPIRARRVSAPERVWRWCRRNPGISWTTLAAAVFVLATVASAFVAITGERNRYASLAVENRKLADNNEQLAVRERVARMQTEGLLDNEKRRAAEEQRLREVAEQEARDRKAVTDFLTRDILAAAQPEVALGRNLTMGAVLDLAARHVDVTYNGNLRTQAAIRSTIGRAYNSLGAHSQAEAQLTRALQQQRELLGETHLDTLDTRNSLAISLNGQGRYAEGLPEQEQIVEILTREHGPDRIDTLVAMSNLSTTYFRLGKLAECRRLQETVLAALRKNFGPQHEQTIRTQVNLAATLHALGEYEDAHALLQEAARNRKDSTLPPTHPLTLAILTNTAVNLVKLGRAEEAERQARQVYTIQQHVLGEHHPSTLTTLGSIALALDYQGKYADAHPLHREVLAERQRNPGPDHPDTLATHSNLAANLVLQQRFDEAQRAYHELVSQLERTFGLEHPLTLQALNNQAAAYRAQGMYAVARQEFTRVIELATRSLGGEHRLTLKFRRHLADNLEQQGEWDEAEREYRDVLAVYRAKHGAGDRSTLAAVQELAGLLIRQSHGRAPRDDAPAAGESIAEAVAILREAIAAAEQEAAADPWRQASLNSLLGEALTRQEKYAEAERVLLAAQQRLATLPLAPPYELRQTLERLVALYTSWGDPAREANADRWRGELEHLGRTGGRPPRDD